jgi:hypothetical protein
MYCPWQCTAFKDIAEHIPRDIEIYAFPRYNYSEYKDSGYRPLIQGYNKDTLIALKKIKKLCLEPEYLRLAFYDKFEELIINSNGEIVFDRIPLNLRKLSIQIK